MPGAKWVSSLKLVDFLKAHGFQIVRENKRNVVLRSDNIAVPIIFVKSGSLTQVEAEDTLANAGIPPSEWEAIL